MLADKDIALLIEDGTLRNADPTRIGPVSYDLRNYEFYRDNETSDSVTLLPGDSTFVGAVESIVLPVDIAAEIRLKNSRIRQGLTLDAPLYFPGHSTRLFFRVTNMTADEITLENRHDIAQVVFIRLATPVDSPYAGAFDREFSFTGLGTYKDVYGSEVREIKRETENLANMEQRIYGNVVAIMGVFIAVFSLANLDLSWLSQHVEIQSLIILNLSIIGGMAALIGLIGSLLGTRGRSILPWVLASVSFAAAIIMTPLK